MFTANQTPETFPRYSKHGQNAIVFSVGSVWHVRSKRRLTWYQRWYLKSHCLVRSIHVLACIFHDKLSWTPCWSMVYHTAVKGHRTVSLIWWFNVSLVLSETSRKEADRCASPVVVIWAAAWQNQQNDMCAQRRLRSVWASAQPDQSLRCALNG